MKSKYTNNFDYTKIRDIVGFPDSEIINVQDKLSTLVDLKELDKTDLRKIRELLTYVDYRVIAFTISETVGIFAEKIEQDSNHPWNELYKIAVSIINSRYPLINPVKICVMINGYAHDKEQSLLCSVATILAFVRSAFDNEDKLYEVSLFELIRLIEKKIINGKNDYLLMSALWFLNANRYDGDECDDSNNKIL